MFAPTHATLMAGRRPTADADESFDAHVLACVVAVAASEAEEGAATLGEATGLDAATLSVVLAHWFPTAAAGGLALDRAGSPPVEMEEEMLRDLLLAHRAPFGGGDRADGGPAGPDLPTVLARVVARRAMRPDHLWQDLGLFDRGELNRLLARHFPALHAGNTANMRWKKYFYRKLCEAEGFVLCTAPSCAECTDFAACFGAEDGESRMAQMRRQSDRAVIAVAAE